VCGIAGYSLSRESSLDRTLLAQSLLAAIAERGADAAGYSYRSPGEATFAYKQRSGASKLLERIVLPETAQHALLHVRDHTKGRPSIEGNNHPIRHGSVVGVHNGQILNDEELFSRLEIRRHAPDMTVDSEIIFAVAERDGSQAKALEQLRGSMAAAWLDDRQPDVLYAARGVGRPLWIGERPGAVLFASTRDALEVAEQFAQASFRMREIDEGTLLELRNGRIVKRTRFTPDRSFVDNPGPAVKSPRERAFCLERLAALSAL
jgi:glucosamine 6-phosphate synthetase-like amidotransferase/phosphosugar isomerase protein